MKRMKYLHSFLSVLFRNGTLLSHIPDETDSDITEAMPFLSQWAVL